jgi:acyl carrier protein
MEFLCQQLRTFIIDNFLFGDASGRFTFSDDDSFQERGIVDSTGILELVCHLQERYAIVIADEELVPDNLDSVSKVARFVERKRQEQVTAVARAS